MAHLKNILARGKTGAINYNSSRIERDEKNWTLIKDSPFQKFFTPSQISSKIPEGKLGMERFRNERETSGIENI